MGRNTNANDQRSLGTGDQINASLVTVHGRVHSCSPRWSPWAGRSVRRKTRAVPGLRPRDQPPSFQLHDLALLIGSQECLSRSYTSHWKKACSRDAIKALRQGRCVGDIGGRQVPRPRQAARLPQRYVRRASAPLRTRFSSKAMVSPASNRHSVIASSSAASLSA